MSANYQEKLPYQTSVHPQMAVIELSKVLGVPVNYKLINSEEYVKLLSGIILYRHLNRIDKQDIMTRIRNLDDPKLSQILVTKVTNVIVQPLWGMWSLSEKELKEYISNNKVILDYFTITGATPGVYGIGAGVWEAIKSGGRGGGFMIFISLVLLGINLGVSKETDALQEELERRMKRVNPSAY